MSVRSVTVRLEAEVASFVAGLGKAGAATDDLAKKTTQAQKAISDSGSAQEAAAKSADKSSEANKKHGDSGKESAKGSEESATAAKKDAEYKAKQADAAEKAGKGLLVFGTSSVAALGASAKAAMDWESAWAGVTKTVNGTPEQMAEMEAGLRGLAKTLPSTHEEIAGVAEAAGQLGVKREDILSFTKTMIDLGTSTNLTAEEAATGIAQIANVMGTSGDEIDNFGATLVALGNAGASTEKDILSMSQRIVGAGKLVGASESDVLALSNTLASMGVNAELGGGVTTRALLKMYSAVQGGGPKLDAFAKAAGVSAESFAKAFRESPVAALELVTKGMARTKEEGGNVVALMSQMGLKGTEEMQVMLSLAGAGDLLSDSLKLGSKAWEENTALINEASKRYETTESKVKIAWNNIKDAAIDAGAVMLPVISGIAENVSGLAQGFGSLPAPLQGAITGLGGVAGAAALAAGGALILVPKISDTIGALKDLNTRADGSSRGLGRLGTAAGVAAGAFIGFEILKSVFNNMQPATQSTEEFTQALMGLSKQKDSLDVAFQRIKFGEGDDLAGQIDSTGEAMERLVKGGPVSGIGLFGAQVLGIDNGMAKLIKGFEATDKAIAATATSGNTKLAAQGFKAVADSAKEHGVSLDKTAEKFPNYLNALRDLASQNKVQVDDAALLKWALGEVPPEMEKVAGSASKAAAGIIDVKGATGKTIPLTKEQAKALEDVGIAADGSILDLDKFSQALLNSGLVELSARDASRGWAQSLLDLGLQADGTGGQIGVLGTAFDNTTAQGIKNQAMFDGVAQAGIRNVEAMAKNKASNEQVQGALQGTYDGLIAAAGQFGITGDAAVNLARDVLKVPPGVSIDSWMSAKAKEMAQATTGELDKIDGRTVRTYTEHREATIRTITTQVLGGGSADDPSMTAFDPSSHASGGEIAGAGPKGVDSELILAAPGEHMLTAREVDMMGGQQAVYRFRAQLRSGSVPAYANGGGIGAMASPSQFMTHYTPPAAANTAAGKFEGNLFLDSGEFLGKVRGVARQEAAGAITGADGQARYTRAGRPS